ncbi:MAG: hypothetical protein ACI9FU_000034 [Granulosicoccus sp.]|jgi:hypothetical protein
MTFAILYKVANASVIPAWLLLVLLPKHRITKFVAHSYLYPVLLGLLYVWLLVTSFGGEGGMDTLANLKLSFGRDEILILGWVHYLVFDLFIGAWIVRDARQNSINHLMTVPCLLLTLFVGPVGLLSYLGLRFWQTKKWQY